MKKITILIIGMGMIFMLSCQQKKSDSTQLKTTDIKSNIKVQPNKTVFDNLDRILSPFEDMTEFALDKNKSGVLKSMVKVDEAKTKGIFEKNITSEGNKLFNAKVEKLRELINQNDYSQISITSTEIFEFNINNFTNRNLIENQISIEHLDYMGFKILALLNQDKIDWKNIKQTINNTQKIWLTLSQKVNDSNLKDTFNYLFKGLVFSTENKDIRICRVLANMDLTLVDVLEKNI
jgi:hypothetical protein